MPHFLRKFIFFEDQYLADEFGIYNPTCIETLFAPGCSSGMDFCRWNVVVPWIYN